MRAAWCPFAERHEYAQWPTGPLRDTEHRKAVWHTTQGGDGVLSWYPVSGGIPHFTIMLNGAIKQHYSCLNFSRALRNLRGGVETNTDGAIQIEIVGYAGKDHTPRQRASITRLTAWFTAESHVAPLLPMGRLSKPYRRATFAEWDHGVGHFGHGNVPEQDHHDPDMTDSTHAALVAGLGIDDDPPPTPAEPAPAPAGSQRSGNRVAPDGLIRPGDHGPGVELFQRRLSDIVAMMGLRRSWRIRQHVPWDLRLGRMGPAVTGVHDVQSVEWCRALQTWAGIEVDGVVGTSETHPAMVDALAALGEPWATDQ
ncbi:MAG: hypothetical protein AAF567_24590 [Actinomycetota bacterium]